MEVNEKDSKPDNTNLSDAGAQASEIELGNKSIYSVLVDIRDALESLNAGLTVGLMDAKQTARFLSMSVSNLYKLKAGGSIPPPVRFGRAIRWDRRELEEWIDAGRPSAAKWLEMRKRK